MKELVSNFVHSKQAITMFGTKDGIIRLIQTSTRIIIEYKDNDMNDFCFGAELNSQDLADHVLIKTICAFIMA